MPASPLCCLQIFDVSVYKKSLPASVRTYPDKSRRINTLQACTLKNGLNRMHLTPRMMLVVLLEAHRCDYGSRCVGEIKRMDVITRGYIRTGYAQTSEDQDKETCMSKRKHTIMAFSALAVLLLPGAAIAKHGSKVQKSSERAEEANAVLWRNPDDIKSRNLFYGPGGEKDTPHTTYTFEKEDMDGTSPKFIVRDEIGVRWKLKWDARRVLKRWPQDWSGPSVTPPMKTISCRSYTSKECPSTFAVDSNLSIPKVQRTMSG